jgi:periplasmic copper chaperone A
MRQRWSTFSLAAAAFSVLLTAAPTTVNAQEIVVEDAWVRATLPGQMATAAFMKITAKSKEATLVGASSSIAAISEIHEMKMAAGVMRMRALADGLALAVNKPVELTPGGHHIMMFDLKRAVVAGEQVPLTLTLVDANGEKQRVQVSAQVRRLGVSNDMPADHGNSDSHGEGMKH